MRFRGKVGRNQRELSISGDFVERPGSIEGTFQLPEGEHLDLTASDYRLTLGDGRSFLIRILNIDYGEEHDQVRFKSNGPF